MKAIEQVTAATATVTRLLPTSTDGRFGVSIFIPPCTEDGQRVMLPESIRCRVIKRDSLPSAMDLMAEMFAAVGGYGPVQWSSHSERKYAYRICENTKAKVVMEELE